MKKVITYGTYDLFHYGHRRLLERAKELGDYLIVGVTSDDFDKKRGKINVQQSLMERIKSIKETGLADEIIIEEYEGQKIDDIIKYGVDIFTVGSDWEGHFDYLNEYCDVIYLPRTEGVSSTEIRTETNKIKLGLVGETYLLKKVANETKYVNNLELIGLYTTNTKIIDSSLNNLDIITDNYDELIDKVDAIYIMSHPTLHFEQIKKALENKKNVLCESPITLSKDKCMELFKIADKNGCVLMDSIKTAYSTAYSRLLLLLKAGVIGDIISVDVTCTSLKDIENYSEEDFLKKWNSICSWGPNAMLPIFQILGTNYKDKKINSLFLDKNKKFDGFTKIDFIYDKAVATLKVGKAVKSEGELVISGTKGYVYIPAPWWKTDYFEIRYENQNENKRYFYQLEGEGIRNELVIFAKTIISGRQIFNIDNKVSLEICQTIDDFYNKNNLNEL